MVYHYSDMSPCSGHGTCSGAPEYTCTCENGWLPPNCQLRKPPPLHFAASIPVWLTAVQARAPWGTLGLTNLLILPLLMHWLSALTR